MEMIIEQKHCRGVLGRWAHFAGEVVCEALWPSRCALCDRPGEVLCARCERDLPFLDQWRACPVCGTPFGLVQCDRCNPVMARAIGREHFPLEGCASATMFHAATSQLVRLYKDQGEQRLAAVFARLMARAASPDWLVQAVTFVPATRVAVRHRGFDHGELLAREVAAVLGVPCVAVLERPATKDQRTLSAAGRVANLSGRFRARPDCCTFDGVLLVDDVMTTGSTLCSAADALLAELVPHVFGLTFARV